METILKDQIGNKIIAGTRAIFIRTQEIITIIEVDQNGKITGKFPDHTTHEIFSNDILILNG